MRVHMLDSLAKYTVVASEGRGAKTAGPENEGPSRNAASLYS